MYFWVCVLGVEQCDERCLHKVEATAGSFGCGWVWLVRLEQTHGRQAREEVVEWAKSGGGAGGWKIRSERMGPDLSEGPVQAHLKCSLQVRGAGGDDPLAAHPHRNVIKEGLR